MEYKSGGAKDCATAGYLERTSRSAAARLDAHAVNLCSLCQTVDPSAISLTLTQTPVHPPPRSCFSRGWPPHASHAVSSLSHLSHCIARACPSALTFGYCIERTRRAHATGHATITRTPGPSPNASSRRLAHMHRHAHWPARARPSSHSPPHPPRAHTPSRRALSWAVREKGR